MAFARPPRPRAPRGTPKPKALDPLGLNTPKADYGGAMPASAGAAGLPGTLIWKSDVRAAEASVSDEPYDLNDEYVIVQVNWSKGDNGTTYPGDGPASDPENTVPFPRILSLQCLEEFTEAYPSPGAGDNTMCGRTLAGGYPVTTINATPSGRITFHNSGDTWYFVVPLSDLIDHFAEAGTFSGVITLELTGWSSYDGGEIFGNPAQPPSPDPDTIVFTRYANGSLAGTSYTGGEVVSTTTWTFNAGLGSWMPPGSDATFPNLREESEGATLTLVDLALSFGQNINADPEDAAIGKLYANGRAIWEGGATTDFDGGGTMAVTTYQGTETQGADPTIAAVEGLSRTPAFRSQFVAVLTDFPLEPFDLTIPSFSAELEGDGSLVAPPCTLIEYIEQVATWAKLDPATDLDIDPAIDRDILGGVLTEDITFGDFLARMGRAYGFTFTEAETIRIRKAVIGSAYSVDYAVTTADLGEESDRGLSTTRPTDATPLKVRLDYFDATPRPMYEGAQRYQPNFRMARRILWPVRASHDTREETIAVPVIMTPSDARRLAVQALSRAVMEQVVHASRHPSKYLFAEVGDVVTLPDGNDTHDAMIDEVEIGPDFAVRLRAVNLVTDEDLGETVQSAPANIVAPTIIGLPRVGNTLTASRGTWNGYPLPAFTYQWEWADTNVPISGATGLTYTIQASDLGHTLSIVVTATNVVGSASAESLPTAAVSATNTAPIDITLSALTVGSTAITGDVVAIITGYDPDGDSLTFTELFDPDNRFTIVGNELRLSTTPLPPPSSHSITIRATDPFGNTYDETFLITVLDEVAPTITSSATASVAENATLSHALTASESVTWSILSLAENASSLDYQDFEISGSTLRWLSNGVRDYENPDDSNTNNAYTVVVRATDAGGNYADQTITISVTDVADTAITWNPADKSAALVLSNGDLTATQPGPTANAKVRANSSKSAGQWVFEVGVIVDLSGQTSIGLASATTSLTGASNLGSSGQDSVGLSTDGGVRVSPVGSVLGNQVPLNFTGGETVMVAVDLDADLIWFRTSGSNWNNSGTANPATGVGGLSISAISGTLYPSVQLRGSNDQMTGNFGASAFVHTIPVGFTSWDGSQTG